MQNLFAALFFILGLSGCAIMGSSGNRQTILVRSHPPGAQILEEGFEIGTTPAYIRVGRARAPKLAVRHGEKIQQLHVDTHYRWRDSFTSNLVFLTYAPIGWAVDLITGAAWDLDDPGLVTFPDSVRQGPVEEKVIAIAPPIGETVEIGDAVGEMLEDQLRSTGIGVVKDYRKTTPIFEYYDFALSDQPRVEKNEMYHDLKVSHIFSSRIYPSSEGFVVKGRLINVFTGKETKLNDFKLVAKTESAKFEIKQRKSLGDLFHFIPNTFFVNFQSDNMSIDIDNQSYEAKHPSSDLFEDKVLRYIGSINLAHMNRPRNEVIGRWYTQFVPSLNLSKDDFRFEEHPFLNSVDFERWYAGAGYGVEYGYLSKYGYFYLNIIPSMVWSRISFKSANFHQSFQNVTTLINMEMGYTYFWSDHWLAKVFVRSRAEDSELWQKAMSQAGGQSVLATYANSAFSGIAIGYYLPESLKGTNHWLIRKR